MMPDEFLSYPWRIDVRALSPSTRRFYLLGWLLMVVFLYQKTLWLWPLLLLVLLWLVLQRSRFILSSWKVMFGSQAASRIWVGSMVLSAGLAHGHRCTGLASTARSSTCHEKLRMGFSVQGIVW